MKKDKDLLVQFDNQVRDIRQQVGEQLKCLDLRVDGQTAIIAEIQDYFRRRAEVELDYSKALDKLAKTLLFRHKTEKQKREHWPLFSSYACWQHLVTVTRQQARHHATLSEVYASHLLSRFAHIIEDVHRIYRRCREIGIEGHEELLKVLHELHTSMKTYHAYHAECKQAESKLAYVEAQRAKFEQSVPVEKLERSKKYKLVVKEIQKRQCKFNEAKLKSVKACNDYLLCMEAANAAIHKYFVDDLSDLIDCMDFGVHTSLGSTLRQALTAQHCVQRGHQNGIDGTARCIAGLDARGDKQRFLEAHNAAFMVPRKFEFQHPPQPPIQHENASDSQPQTQLIVEKAIQEELDLRYKQLNKRIAALSVESEEIWKTLETAEHSLLAMMSAPSIDVEAMFEEDPPAAKPPETLALKLRADRQETEDFYLHKFHEYLQANGLTARLRAKASLLRIALGYHASSSAGSSPGSQRAITAPLHRKKRIGQASQPAGSGSGGQPKLFGGSLEEYIEATNQEIPLIIKSSIRIINLYGLHHQGVFRVSGSQVEINNFKDAFEKGEDPLADMTDASDLNSVAGVLKLYLRELREPLFPIFYFDQLVEISQVDSKPEFITKVRDLVNSLPRSVYVVLRYLFAFLNHLSEFSDENMMDPYNLAICLGPTLLPIPEDRDQVQYQNLVNELVKNIIVFQEEIFDDPTGPRYEKYLAHPIEPEIGESPAAPSLEQAASDCDDDGVFKDPDLSLNLFANGDGELGPEPSLEAVAQYDFLARSDRELSFRRGDTLQLYSQVSGDWWRGSLAGHDGLVPDKYILLKIRDEERAGPECRRASSSSDSLSSHKSCSTSCIPEEDERTVVRRAPHTPPLESSLRRRSLSPSSLRNAAVTWDHPSTSSQSSTHSELPPSPKNEPQKSHESSFSSMSSTSKIRQFKDTPDLVLDLPISPTASAKDDSPIKSSPSSPSSPPPNHNSAESPEMTAAERFALSNQCTMKKGTVARRTRVAAERRQQRISQEIKAGEKPDDLHPATEMPDSSSLGKQCSVKQSEECPP